MPCVQFCTLLLERIPRCRVVASGDGQQGETKIVPGKKFLTEQAATLLNFAKATTNPEVAARLLVKAADLSERSQAAPDASPQGVDESSRKASSRKRPPSMAASFLRKASRRRSARRKNPNLIPHHYNFRRACGSA